MYGEGSNLEFNYSLSRQQVAMQTTKTCNRSFCLCSAIIVFKALGLFTRDLPKQEADFRADTYVPQSLCSVPFAQYFFRVRVLQGGTAFVTAKARGICRSFHGSVELRVSPRQSRISMGACKGMFVDSRRTKKVLEEGVTARLSPKDIVCAVCFTIQL